jgi:hypothetical protein
MLKKVILLERRYKKCVYKYITMKNVSKHKNFITSTPVSMTVKFTIVRIMYLIMTKLTLQRLAYPRLSISP